MTSQPRKIKRTSGKFSPTCVDCKYLWHLIPAVDEHVLVGKLCTFLQGGMWLARLDTFTSSVPEGTLPERNAGLLSKLLGPQQSSMARELYRIGAMKQCFASCWHMSDQTPSCYAWGVFGGQGNGIAIRTTPELMRGALKPLLNQGGGPGYFGKVQYVDHLSDMIRDGNVIEPAFCVQDDYRDENEARVLIHSGGPVELPLKEGPFGLLFCKEQPPIGGFTGGHAGGKAVVVNFPLDSIECIAIGDGVGKPTQKRLSELLTKFNFPKSKICQMTVSGPC